SPADGAVVRGAGQELVDRRVAAPRVVEAALRGARERDHLVDPGIAEGGHALQRGLQRERGAEQEAIALLQRPQLAGAGARPAKTDDVETGGAAGHAVGDDEGQAVL